MFALRRASLLVVTTTTMSGLLLMMAALPGHHPGVSATSPIIPRYCNTTADCVPAECCHPTSCVNANYSGNCSTVACTLECRSNTMDCGQGSCGCVNGLCQVEWAPGHSPEPTTQDTCEADIDCVPAQCCHASSCINVLYAPACSDVGCGASCDPNTMDCGQGSCGCNRGRCYVQWSPGNSAAATTAAPTATTSPNEGFCTADSDCVAAQCCHPTSCINSQYSPDCAGAICTEECRGNTMDCGYGSCGCDTSTSRCVVRWAPGHSAAAPTTAVPARDECSSDQDCAPADCCHSSSCVNANYQPQCFAPCTADCRANTMDCGQGSCMCGANGRCGVRWAPGHSTAAATPPPLPPGSLQCSATSDCVPAECCLATRCVHRSLAPDCTAVACPAICTPDAIGCGEVTCACRADNTCGTTRNGGGPPSGTLPANPAAGRHVVFGTVVSVLLAFVFTATV